MIEKQIFQRSPSDNDIDLIHPEISVILFHRFSQGLFNKAEVVVNLF